MESISEDELKDQLIAASIEEYDLYNDDIEETEEDLDNESLKQMSQIVVYSTDWTTETILNQLKRKNILLNPKYQRRDAWTKAHKSRFIESLFLGLPVPQIILAEQKGTRGKYIVIDGKQRLLSLRQFASGPDDTEYDALKLTGVEILQKINGKTLGQIEEDETLYDELTSFQNQTIRTVVIKNWPNEALLFLLFLRLNTGSVKLSPQELRQALHPGPFVEFLDDFTVGDPLIKDILNLSKPDFRMRDVEVLLRYFAFKNFIGEYSGNMKKFLDHTCEQLNQLLRREEGQSFIDQQVKELRMATSTTYEIFGKEHAFKKWNGKNFENLFNRAVFDIMTFYFRDESICEQAKFHKDKLFNYFKEACSVDRGFRSSLESTTKSIQATYTRLLKWAEILNRIPGIEVPVPELIENRILFE